METDDFAIGRTAEPMQALAATPAAQEEAAGGEKPSAKAEKQQERPKRKPTAEAPADQEASPEEVVEENEKPPHRIDNLA